MLVQHVLRPSKLHARSSSLGLVDRGIGCLSRKPRRVLSQSNPKVPRWLHIGLLEVWGGGGQDERMLSTRLIKLEASFASSFLGM